MVSDRLAAILVGLLAVSGCDLILRPCDLPECLTDQDCATGYVCRASQCSPPISQPTGGSSGGTTTGGGSGGTTTGGGTSGGTGAATSSGSSTGGGTAGGPFRLLASSNANPNYEILDVTDPANAQPLIGDALLGDVPEAVAVGPSGEIFVGLDSSGFKVFDAQGGFEGTLSIAGCGGGGTAPIGSSGMVALPEPDGGTLLAVSTSDGFFALTYTGPSSFQGQVASPGVLWCGNQGGFYQVAQGPAGSLLIGTVSGVDWVTASTGASVGANGTFAAFSGIGYGVARSAQGEILIVGDDGSQNGFAALFNSNGLCLVERTGGVCGGLCPRSCTAHDPTLLGNPLYQAAALPGGAFVATAYVNQTTPADMNEIYELDPSTLAISAYLTNASVDFFALGSTAP
ncbi:MAG: hypothetical protein ACYCWW_03810 [Deltaproteobacteria bacterium]